MVHPWDKLYIQLCQCAPGPSLRHNLRLFLSHWLFVLSLLEVKSSFVSLEINTLKCSSKALKNIIRHSLLSKNVKIGRLVIKCFRTRNTIYKHYIICSVNSVHSPALFDVGMVQLPSSSPAVWIPRMYWVFRCVTIYYWFCQLLITWAHKYHQ